jgi:hypothetical protein
MRKLRLPARAAAPTPDLSLIRENAGLFPGFG